MSPSAPSRRVHARRLAVVAISVLGCSVAALPFAGRGADPLDQLATVAGPASVMQARIPAAVEVAAAPVRAGAPVEEPVPVPIVDQGPPPLPPAPAGADLDPAAGVVPGDTDGMDGPVVAVHPPRRVPDTQAATPGERVWAVVVGIDDYPGTDSDLHAATADAGDLVTALRAFGVPSDHVLAVYDRAATIDGLLAAITWLVERAGPEDTAVFLFAGHIRDLGRGTEAFVTADAGWVTDWFIAERFRGLAARDAWFVIAGCYGGGFDELLAPGRVLTAGAGPGQLAYENDAYGRSYLAEFVLRRGLVEGAAGLPTVQAAVSWGSAQLAERHPDRQVWHADQAGHTVSLDGVRRDGSPQPTPSPSEPPAPPPPQDGGLLGGLGGDCILGVLGTCRED